MTDKKGALYELADQSAETGQPHTKPPSVIKLTTVLSGAAIFAPSAAPSAHIIEPPAQARSVAGLVRSICPATDDDWLMRWLTNTVSSSRTWSMQRQSQSGEIGFSLDLLIAIARFSSRCRLCFCSSCLERSRSSASLSGVNFSFIILLKEGMASLESALMNISAPRLHKGLPCVSGSTSM